MLPILGMLLFALIGIGALVVDGGLALTEQARLETAAEMMVVEWEHLRTDASSRPSECEMGGPGASRARCLERMRIAPLIESLGARVSEGPDGLDWTTEDVSLDGASIDTRGARLGEVGVRNALGLTPGSANEVRLARSTPLLLGWGAIAPETVGGSRPDLADIQEARRYGGISPDLGGTGLRGEGFSLAAVASIDAARVPAMRAGHLGAPSSHRTTTGEVVGLAWLLSDLTSASSALEDTLVDPTAVDFTLESDGLRADGVVVACRFDPRAGAHVGDLLPTASVTSWPGADASARVWGAGYVPVVESCGDARILGFLELGIDARVLTDVAITRPLLRRRNALSTPASPTQGLRAANVLASPARTTLAATDAWRVEGLDLALRVPRVVSRP